MATMTTSPRQMRSLTASRHTPRWGMAATFVASCLTLWLAYTSFLTAAGWATVALNQVRYGYPRTTSMDAYLGVHEAPGLPSHITALNIHGQVLVLIFPGSEPGHITVLRGPLTSPYSVPFIEQTAKGLQLTVDTYTHTFSAKVVAE